MEDGQSQHPHDPPDAVPVPRSRFRHTAQLGDATYLPLVEGVMDRDAERPVIRQIGGRLVGAGAYKLVRLPVHQVQLPAYVLQEEPVLHMEDQRIGGLSDIVQLICRHRRIS